jgi:hypothetical protein
VVTEALAQGKIIIIADENYMSIVQNGVEVYVGDGLVDADDSELASMDATLAMGGLWPMIED